MVLLDKGPGCVCVCAPPRCLPLNLRKDDLLGVQKDRMKIGASLADVDPMQIDQTVRPLFLLSERCGNYRRQLWTRVCSHAHKRPHTFMQSGTRVASNTARASVNSTTRHSYCILQFHFKNGFVCLCFSQVRFDSIGGLTRHIAALKEMVVFPLLYPEVFERFKIQPPRYHVVLKMWLYTY